MPSNLKLFPEELIHSDVQSGLPAGYVIRPLQRDDYGRGHLEPLRDLTHVGDITEGQWLERFDWMARCTGTYYTVVIVSSARGQEKAIVATGTLFVEKKFLYKLATQGHIEDIAVVKDQQGKKLGLSLLAALNGIAQQVGCYKTILDCGTKNVGFYERCGFNKAGHEMECYFDEEARERRV